MTYKSSGRRSRWRPSPRWLFLVPALLLAGTVSAVLTVANPPEGVAEVRYEFRVPTFVNPAPVYDPPEFDAYFVEENSKAAGADGEIE